MHPKLANLQEETVQGCLMPPQRWPWQKCQEDIFFSCFSFRFLAKVAATWSSLLRSVTKMMPTLQ
jgi:hypothetical protein